MNHIREIETNSSLIGCSWYWSESEYKTALVLQLGSLSNKSCIRFDIVKHLTGADLLYSSRATLINQNGYQRIKIDATYVEFHSGDYEYIFTCTYNGTSWTMWYSNEQ